MRQGRFSEFNIGGNTQFSTGHSLFPNLYSGIWWRTKDAVIIRLGFDYKRFNTGISYDINISNLSEASRGRGAIELSMRYIFNRIELIKPPYKTCPVFL